MEIQKSLNYANDSLMNIFHNGESSSYIYDTGAGTTYICFAGEDGIATTDAKWKITSVVVAGNTTTIEWAGDKAFTHKLDSGGGVPGILAAYTYVYLKS